MRCLRSAFPAIRFVPAHLTPRYPVLRPGEDIIREKQQNFVLINTISFRARDVDSELVYRNGRLVDRMRVLRSKSHRRNAERMERSRHRTGPRCCLTGEKLRPNWVANFFQLGSKKGVLYTLSWPTERQAFRVPFDTHASVHTRWGSPTARQVGNRATPGRKSLARMEKSS